MLKNIIRLSLSLCIGIFLLYFTAQYIDVRLAFDFMRNAHSKYLVYGITLLIVSYILRGFRWKIWERDLTFKHSFRVLMIGFMGNNILPARLGELLRAHCTAARTSESHGRTAALASITIERVLDGFVIAIIGLTGLVFTPVNAVLFNSLLIVSVAFSALTACLIVGIYFHMHIRGFLERLSQTFPGHLTSFGKSKINFFLDGLLLIGKPKLFIHAFLFTVLIWGVELGEYYFIAKSVEDQFSFQTCFVFLSVVNFASLFPFTVGGIGIIEGVTSAFLISAGVPSSRALAMVLMQHIFQFLFTTAGGGFFYFKDGYFRLPFLAKIPKNSITVNSPSLKPSPIIENTQIEIDSFLNNLNIAPVSQFEPEISIVIPAYNEQRRLPKTLLSTLDWCQQNLPSYEIIIVDDGSTDDTPVLSGLFSKQIPEIRHLLCPHFGKGAAVRMGMLNAVGRYVLFMDADGATPLHEIKTFHRELQNGCDIAIGSRVVQNPDETQVDTSFHRKIIGRTFAAIVNVFAVPGFADTQCGFKMFRQQVIREIFGRQKLMGFAFDVEVLYIAKALSLEVSEVPVNWVNQPGSKVNILTDSIKMFYDILRIKWIHKDL